MKKEFVGSRLAAGSPLSNLIQEMSPLDEGFRIRLESIVYDIKQLIETAIVKGIERKEISAHVDASGLAWFVLATFEGSYAVSKVSKSEHVFVEVARWSVWGGGR